ncbi:MAG: hypothetical protein HYT62_00670 [Candidatus Yanofskybacteria bacterium]|nr:hypothetical protein [Candidatus Yanofskybacteria bacterium]
MPAPYCGINRSSHRHLDGSRVLLNILPRLHTLSGREYPFNPWLDHHRQIINWFSDVHGDIVTKFSVTTGVMQSPITIFKAAEEYVTHYARQGFNDLKITVAPQYHVFGDKYTPKGLLDEESVMRLFISGLKEGINKAKIETGHTVRAKMLFGIGREVSSDKSIRLVDLAANCDPEYVAGITLVCNEPQNPPEKHLEAFLLAKNLGIRERRCHVEWVKDRTDEEKNTPEKILANYEEDKPQLRKNLETAIFKLEATHIDHAFSLPEHDDLIDEVVKRNIGITVCPGSLLFTKLIHGPKILQLRKLLQAGVRVSIDSDDDLFMMDLDEVFQFLNDFYHFTPEEIAQLNKNA